LAGNKTTEHQHKRSPHCLLQNDFATHGYGLNFLLMEVRARGAHDRKEMSAL